MKKTISIVLSVMLLMTMSVMALDKPKDVKVDCGNWGDWNTPVCMDYELEQEFSQLSWNDKLLFNNDVDLYKKVMKNKYRIKSLAQRLKEYRQKVNEELSELNERTEDNREYIDRKWDNNGGGMSDEKVWQLVTGSSRLIDYFDNMVQYLKTIFVTKQEFKELKYELYEYQCRAEYPVDEYGIWEWQYCYLQKQADYEGVTKVLNGKEFSPN